jgi:hypothetical protein
MDHMLDAVCTLEDHVTASDVMMNASAKIDIAIDITIAAAGTDPPFLLIESASPFARELDHQMILPLRYYIYID